MFRIRSKSWLLVIGALSISGTASAAPLSFNFVDTTGKGFNFLLDSNPTPSTDINPYFGAGSPEFHVDGIVNGVATSNIGGGIGFRFGGDEGFIFNDDSFAAFGTGTNFMSGTASSPIFNIGSYTLRGTYYTFGGTLSISAAIAAVPEPATWAMMIGGFGLVGGTLRRRQRQQTPVSYAA